MQQPSPAQHEIPRALPKLVVFGEALTDFVRTDEDQWRSVPGGACWNVARVASTLGVPTGWGGSVGNDLFGDELMRRSAEAGLDLRFAQQVGQPPLLAIVHALDPPQYFFVGSADQSFDAALLPEGWREACEYAHFGCISLVRQPLGARLLALAEELHARGVRISFDPNCRNLMGADYPPLFERLAAIADLVKLSDEDLRQIYPPLPAGEALGRVRGRMKPGALLLYTRGADGMTLHLEGRRIEQPALAVAVRDTVGAGDACVGGFLASMLQQPEQGWEQHLRFAAAVAAAACTRAGAHAPDRREVEALLAADAGRV
ncbi:carbohydrate kinase family protein [Luteimonas sp. A482]